MNVVTGWPKGITKKKESRCFWTASFSFPVVCHARVHREKGDKIKDRRQRGSDWDILSVDLFFFFGALT